MKILLINPPSELEFSLFVLDDYNSKARSHAVPLWALYLHAYLKDAHTVEIFDMGAMELPIKAVQGKIDTFNPDLIGITCTIAQWNTVRELSKQIKNYSNIKIVAGGINPSLYTYETLQCPDIDYVIQGFGQEPLSDLCDAIENDYNTEDIPDVFTKKNCNKKTKGSFWFRDVDQYPMPDRSILNINDYTMPFFGDANPVTSSVTSFGCPYRCRYCACSGFKPLIFRSPKNIVNEMKHIQSIDIKGIIFNDELFAMSKNRINKLCSAIIDNNIDLKISLRSRANLVNTESLKMLKDAGVFNVHLGIENGNDRILTEMNKQLTVETIRKSVETIKSVGMGVTASFMLGYKNESEKEIMQTIQFSKELKLNNSQYFVVQPEPNTPLYHELKDIKRLPDDIYSAFTLNPDNVDLKNNIASTIFTKKEMDDFLRYAYTQTRNLYDIKKEYQEHKK